MKLVYQRSAEKLKSEFNWHYVYQNADPESVPKMGKQQKIRRTKDGHSV